MSEYDLPTTMNGGALVLALLGIAFAVVMLAILRQRNAAAAAPLPAPAKPARPCLCGHGALDHDDNGDCAGVYTCGPSTVLCTCGRYSAVAA